MDPKKLPTLDPKLKEAYERVMSTSITPSAPNPTPTTPPAGPAEQPKAETPLPSAPQAPLVAAPSTEGPKPINVPKPANSSTFVAGTTNSSGGSKISPVLLVVAGVIFFAVYTLFWLRFFNVSLPFLP